MTSAVSAKVLATTLGLLFVLWFSSPQPLAAEDVGVYERRVYETKFAETPPNIDGKIDDDVWNQVEWAGDFVQWEPQEGDPPSQRTAFKILYDDRALYVAYRAFDDEPDKIVNRLARRDWFPGDWVEINIDSYHDSRTAFSFTASVSGTRGDEFISQDGDHWDGNWDPIWQLETHIDDQGWTAEALIPLSQLRFSSAEDQVWGIQVQRRLFRKQERSLWQPKSKDEGGWVSRFGELRGLRGIQAQKQIELLPYTVTKAERFESVPGDPFRDGQTGDLGFGLDGKIGVTSDLTLDFTMNPDFGQVEADPSQVNLSAFETFFDEKRPFFIEGSNILNFQLTPAITGGSFTADNLFYSRRIGRRPRYFPALGANEFADVPDNTSIIGAFKLTGKTKNGVSVGVLESVTAKESAKIDNLGQERKENVEPLTNFFVGRVQKDFDQGNTRLGGMFTATNRDLSDPHLRFQHRAAYTGGLDFLHRWGNKSWSFDAKSSFSHVEGDEGAILRSQTSSARYFQRPDNDYADFDSSATSLSGYAGSFRLGKTSGTGVRFQTGAGMRSPGYEINDLGFMRSADEVNQFTWVGYSIRNPFSIFRRMGVNFNQWLNWDFGGNRLSEALNTNFNVTFLNNWALGAGVNREFEWQSNTQLRGGPSSLWPGNWNGWFWVNSDARRKLRFDFGGDWVNGDEGSSKYRGLWAWSALQPNNALRITFSPSISANDRELQFIGRRSFAGDDRYLFGRLEQTTFSLTMRLDYTITPNLTIQYYGSPFVSAGDYMAFKRITDPRGPEYLDRFDTFGDAEITFNELEGQYEVDEDTDGSVDYTFSNPNFNFRDFNSNLVLRWEFQPGSTMFLVWSQARQDFVSNGNFRLRNDLDGLFGVHPHNVFLLKVNKWFSL